MNIKDFAVAVIKMNNPAKTQQAITNLRHGLQNEPSWNGQHRQEVSKLIAFLEAGETDIVHLDSDRFAN